MGVILPPVANTMKVVQNWHIGSNLKAENIFHFGYTGGTPTAADLAGFAAAIQAESVSDWKTNTHSSVSIGLVTCVDIASNTGAQGTAGTVTAGTLTGNFLGASICVVMSHKIALRYRGGHPRSYLPIGSSSSASGNGTWGTGITSSFNTDFQNWVTNNEALTQGAITLTGFKAVSYFSGNALRVTPQVFAIQQSVAQARMGSQRRRLKTA